MERVVHTQPLSKNTHLLRWVEKIANSQLLLQSTGLTARRKNMISSAARWSSPALS